MDPSFWLEKWQQGQHGFHQDAVHRDLQDHAEWLLGGGPRRVLVPLCGKSRDVHWMAQQGHAVVGVELSEQALVAMHTEQGLTFSRREVPPFRVLHSGPAHLLAGDLFDLSAEVVDQVAGGPPDRAWDRAALVALRPDQRQRYIDVLTDVLAPGARVLLNVLVYDPAVMDGPPWTVDEATVRSLWSHAHVELLDRHDAIDDEPRWRERGHTFFRRDLYAVTLPG